MRCSGCIERWRVCTIACEWHVASQPDARMKKILEEAANVGIATVCTRAARPREDMFSFYPGKGVWSTPFPGVSHEFLEDGAACWTPVPTSSSMPRASRRQPIPGRRPSKNRQNMKTQNSNGRKVPGRLQLHHVR